MNVEAAASFNSFENTTKIEHKKITRADINGPIFQLHSSSMFRSFVRWRLAAICVVFLLHHAFMAVSFYSILVCLDLNLSAHSHKSKIPNLHKTPRLFFWTFPASLLADLVLCVCIGPHLIALRPLSYKLQRKFGVLRLPFSRSCSIFLRAHTTLVTLAIALCSAVMLILFVFAFRVRTLPSSLFSSRGDLFSSFSASDNVGISSHSLHMTPSESIFSPRLSLVRSIALLVLLAVYTLLISIELSLCILTLTRIANFAKFKSLMNWPTNHISGYFSNASIGQLSGMHSLHSTAPSSQNDITSMMNAVIQLQKESSSHEEYEIDGDRDNSSLDTKLDEAAIQRRICSQQNEILLNLWHRHTNLREILIEIRNKTLEMCIR